MRNSDLSTGLLSFGLIVGVFLIRPGALGQNYTPVGLVVIATVGAVFLIQTRFRVNAERGLRKEVIGTAIIWSLFVVYESLLLILFAKANGEFFLYDIVVGFTVLCVYGSFLINGENNRVFFRYFSTVIGLLGCSCGISFLLFQIVGPDAIHMFDIGVKGYEGSGGSAGAVGMVYFPLSMLYQNFAFGRVNVPRFCGFFREAGIFQAFACFCFVYESFTRRSRWVRAGHVVAVLTSLSSIGVVLLAACSGLVFVLRRKLTFTTVVATFATCLIAVTVALYTPVIGLNDKMQGNKGSVSDRSVASRRGIERALANPLGDGPSSDTTQNSGITLIASVGALGFFGALLQALLLSGLRGIPTHAQSRKLLVCFPLLATALFAQPIAGSGAIYVMVMAWLPATSEPRDSTLRRRATPGYLP